MMLSGVKIGDIIEIAYTQKGQNPIFSHHFNSIAHLSCSEKIEKLYYRFIKDKNKPLYFKTYNSSIAIQEKLLDNQKKETSLLISPTNVKEVSNIPNWYIPYEMLQITDFHSWQEVSAWGKTCFEPPGKDVSDKISRIIDGWHKQGQTSKQDLALKALHFVQNEIRYFGMEDGIYSHKPRDPLNTLDRGYGDCKDKTLLLKAFMDTLEIVETIRFSSDEPQGHVDEKGTIEHPAFVFEYEFSSDGDDLLSRYFYQTKADHILSQDLAALRTDLLSIQETLNISYNYASNTTKDSKPLFAVGIGILVVAVLMYGLYLKLR